MRHEQRRPDQLRPIRVERHFTRSTPGSVLIQAGRTTVLCTASVDEALPPWMKAADRGWVTAEYSMLPGSTSPRKGRDRGTKVDGRTTEIQRLIGRSLRAAVDLTALGPRSIYLDCDVLEADGGTRTLSITGAWLALADAVNALKPFLTPDRPVLLTNVAAVSVGLVKGELLLDLDYAEDSVAEVDMNVVMTGAGEFVEIQGTAEGRAFNRGQLDAQLGLAQKGIEALTDIQRQALGADWPL
jgi:ribonuclease PH